MSQLFRLHCAVAGQDFEATGPHDEVVARFEAWRALLLEHAGVAREIEQGRAERARLRAGSDDGNGGGRGIA